MAGKKKTKKFPVKKTAPGGEAEKRAELTAHQDREIKHRQLYDIKK